MRIHNLPGHTPSEEWLNKTDLEIHKGHHPANEDQGGYYIRHGNKGMIFWGIDGETILRYLMDNYAGFRTWVYCDFDVGLHGRVQGSKEQPVLIRWELTNNKIS